MLEGFSFAVRQRQGLQFVNPNHPARGYFA
jgi:hypothetical protein